jgi:hypothetical protein
MTSLDIVVETDSFTLW